MRIMSTTLVYTGDTSTARIGTSIESWKPISGTWRVADLSNTSLFGSKMNTQTGILEEDERFGILMGDRS